MSDYAQLLDDLDAWATVQPDAAAAIRTLLRELDEAIAARNVAIDNGLEALVQRDEARALLNEWICADALADGHGYGICDDDLTERTEAALAGGEK